MDFKEETEKILGAMGGYAFAGSILAGGAITSTFTKQEIRDFDLYFRSKAAFVAAVEQAYDGGFWCVSLSSRAITFAKGSLVCQMMHFKWFADASAIFDSFDFTCCMAALDIDSKALVFHPRFLADTSKRDLIFNHGTDFPLASGVRLLKYQGRGYSISKREMIKLLTACMLKKVESWDELKEQIGGHYGESVSLDTGKPFTADNITAAIDAVQVISGTDAQEMPSTAEAAFAAIWPVAASVAA